MEKDKERRRVIDWLAVAGFVLGLTALVLDLRSAWTDRAILKVRAFATEPPAGSSIEFRVLGPVPSDAQLSWMFNEDGAVARLNERVVTSAATIDGKPARPLFAVATNEGRRPIRLISATITYGASNGNLRLASQPIDYLLTEDERRRAIIDIATAGETMFSAPLAVGVLDEVGNCYWSVIVTDHLERFVAKLQQLPAAQRCEDAELSRRIRIQ